MLNTDHLLILAVLAMAIAFLETVAVVSLVALALGHPQIVKYTFNVVDQALETIIQVLNKSGQ